MTASRAGLRLGSWSGMGLVAVLCGLSVGSGAIAQTVSTLPATSSRPLTQPVAQPTANYLLFVNPTAGNDSGDGSQSAPFRTITRALQSAQANTAVILSPGVYSAETGETFPLVLKPGVILQGDPSTRGEGIVIRGGADYLSRTAARQNITILGSNQSVLTGVTVINSNFRGYGLWIESSSPLVVSNTFQDSLHDGISVNGTSVPRIEDNLFTENGASGISVFGNSQPHIEGNVFRQTGYGINVAENAAPMIIGNEISGNRNGIVVQENARPTLRNNLIEASQEDGLVAISRSLPDLGTTTDPGNNIFRNNGDDDIEVSSQQTVPAFGNELTASRVIGQVDLTGQVVISPVAPVTAPATPTVTPRSTSASSTTVAAAPGGLTGLPTLEPAPVTVTVVPPTRPSVSERETSQPAVTTTAPATTTPPISRPPVQPQTRQTVAVQVPVTPTPPVMVTRPVTSTTPAAISVAPPSPSPARSTPAVRDAVVERPTRREVAFVAPSAPAPSSSQERAVPSPVPPAPVATVTPPSANRSVSPPSRSTPPDYQSNLLPVPGPDIPVGNTGDLPRVVVPQNASQRSSSAPTSDTSQAVALGLRYRVLVEGASERVQEEVRALIPGAFRTTVGGRTVMQAGAFGDRTNAQDVVDLLSENGLRAVIQQLE